MMGKYILKSQGEIKYIFIMHILSLVNVKSLISIVAFGKCSIILIDSPRQGHIIFVKDK